MFCFGVAATSAATGAFAMSIIVLTSSTERVIRSRRLQTVGLAVPPVLVIRLVNKIKNMKKFVFIGVFILLLFASAIYHYNIPLIVIVINITFTKYFDKESLRRSRDSKIT